MDSYTLGWLTGIIEGDGTIYKNGYNNAIVCISMTDRDTIMRISKIVNKQYHKRPFTKMEKRKKYKQQYRVYICGKDVHILLSLIYPYMSKHRKQQIRKVYKACFSKNLDKSKELKLGWLVGLIESDGYIGRVLNNPRLVISMLDKYVLIKAGRLVGLDIQRDGKTSNGKQRYAIRVGGEKVVHIIKKIKPLLSRRRQKQCTLSLLNT